MEKQNRNISIDILKFFAVLLITNSHFDQQYVYCKELATGGAIGDALFFFCSGYTLFLGRFGRFDTWYKRRIRRIYPSVVGLVLIALFLYHSDMQLGVLLSDGAGWFVSCIMIYYVLLYYVRKYAIGRLKIVYVIYTLFVLLWYSLFFDPFHALVTNNQTLNWLVFCTPMDKVWIYQWNYLKWGFFFLFMLFGADLGLKESHSEKINNRAFAPTFSMLLFSCVLFYALPLISVKYPICQKLLIFSLIPLAGVCLYFYRLCQTDIALRLYQHKYMGWIVKGVGGLCLEIYLVQPYVRTTALNYLFPFNIIILFVAIVVVAYLCRSIGRWFQQTFSNEDGYDWKAIFKIV